MTIDTKRHFWKLLFFMIFLVITTSVTTLLVHSKNEQSKRKNERERISWAVYSYCTDWSSFKFPPEVLNEWQGKEVRRSILERVELFEKDDLPIKIKALIEDMRSSESQDLYEEVKRQILNKKEMK